MRRILTIVTLLMACAMLWAVALPAAAQDAGEVTLTMWTDDGLYVQFFGARAEEWKERYPDIDFTFEFELVPGVFDKVLGNLANRFPICWASARATSRASCKAALSRASSSI